MRWNIRGACKRNDCCRKYPLGYLFTRRIHGIALLRHDEIGKPCKKRVQCTLERETGAIYEQHKRIGKMAKGRFAVLGF
jgi:hypothetical protein